MQVCADDFGREKDDDHGARSFLHKYMLEFQDLYKTAKVPDPRSSRQTNRNNSRRNFIKMQLCADDFGREKDDDYGARSFLHI